MKKIIFILLLLNSSFVLADQKDSRLNSLFDELFLSNDNMQASTILADIWDIWSIAENVEAQKIFNLSSNLIDIIIHPNSLVHAVLELKNGLKKFIYHETTMIIPLANAIFDGKLDINQFYKDKKVFGSEDFIFDKVNIK